MAEGRLLRELVRAGSRKDESSFRTVAEEVIREERAKRHHLLANDLERILYAEPSSSDARPAWVGTEVPKDKERDAPLLEARQPVRELSDLVLDGEARAVLDAVLMEQARVDVLGSHGLRPLGRLLFCGPPGCGKTSAAEALATELGLPFFIVRFDAVVSSFLGETAANLRKVFEFLAGVRCVAVFDEFDAIGKEREDPSEHGELRRVVNAFLQMLDSYRGQSILIAATNHERMLDRALWRRFEEVVLFKKPTGQDFAQLLAIKLRGVRHELPLGDPNFLKQFKGFSHADVERVVIRAIKQMVLKGREFVTVDLVREARAREQHRLDMLSERKR